MFLSGDYRESVGGGWGINCHQKSIKGEYTKLTAY